MDVEKILEELKPREAQWCQDMADILTEMTPEQIDWVAQFIKDWNRTFER